MTIEASNLSFRYGDKPVLREVSFALTSGRFHALLGPNGAGKSTLFGLLTRLLALQQGDIRLGGQSLKKRPAEAMRQIGVVFQQNALDLDLTVRQNLQYHAALHGLSRKEARARGDRELERFNLLERAKDAVRHSCMSPRCCCSTNPRWAWTLQAARRSTNTFERCVKKTA